MVERSTTSEVGRSHASSTTTTGARTTAPTVILLRVGGLDLSRGISNACLPKGSIAFIRRKAYRLRWDHAGGWHQSLPTHVSDPWESSVNPQNCRRISVYNAQGGNDRRHSCDGHKQYPHACDYCGVVWGGLKKERSKTPTKG